MGYTSFVEIQVKCGVGPPGELREALTQAYLKSGPISTAALEAAQRNGVLRYRTASDGTIVVALPGRPEVPLAPAQQLGWI
jgi:hypothetical protein